MTREELECRIRAAVAEYLAEEESYDDNAQLQIDPETLKVTVVDSEDVDAGEGEETDPRITGMDYYDVMDLVKMDPDQPGRWITDEESVASVAEEYVK